MEIHIKKNEGIFLHFGTKNLRPAQTLDETEAFVKERYYFFFLFRKTMPSAATQAAMPAAIRGRLDASPVGAFLTVLFVVTAGADFFLSVMVIVFESVCGYVKEISSATSYPSGAETS